MDPDRRAFYRFHASVMEPWDGPASVTFSDGTVVVFPGQTSMQAGGQRAGNQSGRAPSYARCSSSRIAARSSARGFG